jgi:hypothetical protein
VKNSLQAHLAKLNECVRNSKNIRDVIPKIFCLEDIQCSPDDAGGFSYRANLYHDQTSITVSFNCREFDASLENGQFISVRWLPEMRSDQGAIQVAGLTALNYSAKEFPSGSFSVPHNWKSVDRHLINCARNLWIISSKEMQQMLCATVLAQAGSSGRESAWQGPAYG